MDSIINILPLEWRQGARASCLDDITDIRMIESLPVVLFSGKDEYFMGSYGRCPKDAAFIATASILSSILRFACENSVYSHMEDIREGFITLKGGHRLGICGKAVYEEQIISNIKNISGINIRIAGEVPGVSFEIAERIINDGRILNTLIISPPGGGKTTILRDLARNFGNRQGFRPVLIDSRNELASVYQGVASLNVGERTLILSGYKKSDGFTHGVRNLSPDVIFCDEIAAEDIGSLKFALNCGVSVVATAHGSSLDEIRRKMDISGFERIVILSKKSGNAQIINTGE